jgi:PmbA protein
MLSVSQAEQRVAALVERARKAGADAADAIYIGDASTGMQVRLGALEDVERSEGEEMGLRFFHGRRSATVSSSDLSPDALAALVERASAMAREAPEDPWAGLAPEEMLMRGAGVDVDADDGADPAPTELKALASQIEEAARTVPGVTNSEGAGVSAGRSVIALATSHGFCRGYSTSGYSGSASVIAGAGASMQRDYSQHSVRHFSDLDPPEAIGRLAGQRAVARLDPTRLASGAMPVVFDPRVGSSLLGHRPRGLRSKPFDGEGLPTGPRDLVASGRLTGWLMETASARQLGLQPTGHATRGAGGAPGASASNVHMEAGSLSREELLSGIVRGVYVTELIGQGVNPVTGDYSRGASGFLIENGKLGPAVAEITIAGNLLAMFRQLTPGSDLEFRRAVNVPTLRIDGMTVAGA